MSDDNTPVEATDSHAETSEARKSRDLARLKAVGIKHGAAFLTAVTLWGAADYWAANTGLMLAQGIALLNALFAGVAISYLVHEWGHFTGARVAGAVSPVLKEPVSFFMFSFKHDLNSRKQFLSMSVGGPLGNWLLVLAVILLLPFETASQAMLLAATAAIAVSVSVFEVPIMIRVIRQDIDPEVAIETRLKEDKGIPRLAGIVVGAVLWLVMVI